MRVSPVRIHRRERHGRHARDEGCRGEREREREVRGRTAGRTGIQGLEQDGERQGWNERSGQAREERRKSQEGRSETSESFGVGSGGGGGTKRREGERVVARRGARRRRERAAGGSIHPSAAFFSPCVARTMALDAARSLARSCRLRSPAISLLRRGSRERPHRGKRLTMPPPLFFSSSPLALARRFSLQGITIIQLSSLFHSFTLFAPLSLSVLRLISKRETFIVVEHKLKKN